MVQPSMLLIEHSLVMPNRVRVFGRGAEGFGGDPVAYAHQCVPSFWGSVAE